MMLQNGFNREVVGIQDVLEQLLRRYTQRRRNCVCGGLTDNLSTAGSRYGNSIEARQLGQFGARNLPFGQQRAQISLRACLVEHMLGAVLQKIHVQAI